MWCSKKEYDYFCKSKYIPKSSYSGIRVLVARRISSEGGSRFCYCFLDEVLRYTPRLVLVEHAVHKRDLCSTAPCLCFCRAILFKKILYYYLEKDLFVESQCQSHYLTVFNTKRKEKCCKVSF